MAVFGAYCVVNNIMIPEIIQVALFGSPLAYGASRHQSKKDTEKTSRAKIEKSIDWDEIWEIYGTYLYV